MNPAEKPRGNTKPNPKLHLPQGEIEGFTLSSREGKDYYGFYGIPFAKTPKRFQPPERWENWEGVLDATKAKERCAQASLITRKVFGSEDCLFANVFTPYLPPATDDRDPQSSSSEGERELLPVMVFIFGGGFYVGGGDLYGGKLLSDLGVVLVTFNYRLGALGFLNSEDGTVSGNMGLKDQTMCLKWVQENISFFGGDCSQTTLFGESAGGACVHFHMLSPMSKGLFQKAIIQSGSALGPYAFIRNPGGKVRELVTRLGLECDLEDMPQMIDNLLEVNPFALAAQNMNYEKWQNQDLIHFAPSVESGEGEKFLADDPINILNGGVVNEVPFIIGVNAQEGVYKAIPLLQNPTKLRYLNESWADFCPPLILSSPKLLKNHFEFASAVRKFYFGEEAISLDTRDRFVDMISDRFFIHPARSTASMHLHRHAEGNPIFLYYFDYHGEHSYLNSFGVFETYGPTHADELQYIMNQRIFYSKISPGSDDDAMISKMTEMWANFAKSGRPFHSKEDSGWECLSPLDKPLRYYKISDVDAMIQEPFQSRMAFWDSLHFDYC